jgi:glycosyltransferase involved in cell wall biosynthesis
LKKVLSVIVGVYNPPIDKFKKCVDSILNQTYNKLEIILLDDGSTNGAQDICDDYEKKDHRVSVIHQKNYGAHAKFEIGYKMATGNYITNVDHDDYLELDFYEKMMDVANSRDVDVVDAGYLHHDYRTKEVSSKFADSSFEIHGSKNIIMAAINGRIAVDSWCRIFKKELIKQDQDWNLSDPLTFIGAETLVHISFAGYHFVNVKGTTSSERLNSWMLEQLNLFEDKTKVSYSLSVYPFLKDYINQSRVAWLFRCYFYMLQTPKNAITSKFRDSLVYEKDFAREINGVERIKYYLVTHKMLYVPFKIYLNVKSFKSRRSSRYE